MTAIILLLAIAALAGGAFYAHRHPEKAKLAASWIKDHAPAFTVSFVTFSALWVAVLLTELTLFVFDASFYRSLAPPGMEIWFQSIGVCFRLIVIFGGLAIVWGKQNKMPDAALGTLRFLFVFSFCAVMVSALGYVSEGGDYHYRKNASIAQTEAVSADNADAIIAAANAEIAAQRADRDRQTAAARASMNLVLDDGNSKNDDVSQYEANIRQYDQDAQIAIKAQQDIIAEAQRAKLDAKKQATVQAVGDPGLATVFRFPGRYVDGWDGVTFRDAFSLFWVILLEAIGAFGAQSLLTLHMAMSKRKIAQAAGAIGGKTTARRNRVSRKLKAIEDLRGQKTQTASDLTADTEEGEFSEDEEADEDEPETPRQAAE